jgi:ABC-2 type transport system ATP-binding protein
VTTHYLAEAAYCGSLALMHEGRLIASGEIASLRAGLGAQAPDSVEDIFLAYLRREHESAGWSTGTAT